MVGVSLISGAYNRLPVSRGSQLFLETDCLSARTIRTVYPTAVPPDDAEKSDRQP